MHKKTQVLKLLGAISVAVVPLCAMVLFQNFNSFSNRDDLDALRSWDVDTYAALASSEQKLMSYMANPACGIQAVGAAANLQEIQLDILRNASLGGTGNGHAPPPALFNLMSLAENRLNNLHRVTGTITHDANYSVIDITPPATMPIPASNVPLAPIKIVVNGQYLPDLILVDNSYAPHAPLPIIISRADRMASPSVDKVILLHNGSSSPVTIVDGNNAPVFAREIFLQSSTAPIASLTQARDQMYITLAQVGPCMAPNLVSWARLLPGQSTAIAGLAPVVPMFGPTSCTVNTRYLRGPISSSQSSEAACRQFAQDLTDAVRPMGFAVDSLNPDFAVTLGEAPLTPYVMQSCSLTFKTGPGPSRMLPAPAIFACMDGFGLPPNQGASLRFGTQILLQDGVCNVFAADGRNLASGKTADPQSCNVFSNTYAYPIAPNATRPPPPARVYFGGMRLL